MRLAVIALLCSITLPAQAATADVDFLSRLAGKWQGNGTLQDGGTAKPISCNLTSRLQAGKLVLTGACSGAAKGAKLAGNLRWSEGAGRYLGRLQGASLSGTREVSGTRSGDTLKLRISGDAAASSLALKAAPATLLLTISDSRGKKLLNLPLTKR